MDGVQNVNESGASSLIHDWTLLSVFVEGGVANTIDLFVLPSDERINPGFQEPFIPKVKGRTRLKKELIKRLKALLLKNS